MRASRFRHEQIEQALRQAEAGTPVVDICPKLNITETTVYRWKNGSRGWTSAGCASRFHP